MFRPRNGVLAAVLLLLGAGAALSAGAGCSPPPEPEQEESRPILDIPGSPWPEEDGIDYYPREAEMDAGWAYLHYITYPLAPACERDEPQEEGPGAGLMHHEWDTPLIGGIYNSRVVAPLDRALLYRTTGRLWKIDRETGEVLFVTRDYNWTGGLHQLHAGMDGLAYLTCPDILAIDPEDLRPLRSTRSTGFNSHCNPPLILPDGRIAIHSLYGTLTMYRPLPPPEGETVGGYEAAWSKKLGSRSWDSVMVYDEERDIIITGGLGRDPDIPSGVRALRAEDGSRVWITSRGGGNFVLIGDETFIMSSGEWQEAEDRYNRTLERRSLLTGELEAMYSWLPAMGVDPSETGSGNVVATPDGSRVYMTRAFSTRREHGGLLRYSEVMAFDRDLNLLWSFFTDEPEREEPIVLESSRDMIFAGVASPLLVLPDSSVVFGTQSCEIVRLGPNGHVYWSDLLPYPLKSGSLNLDGGHVRALAHYDPRRRGAASFNLLRSYRLAEHALEGPIFPPEDAELRPIRDAGPGAFPREPPAEEP